MRICLGFLISISVVCGSDSSPDRIRDAATRAVGLLQKSQKNWYSKQQCWSCHHQSLPALAFRVARRHSIPVNEPLAHADAVAGLGIYANLDRAIQYTHIVDPPGEGYGLAAADAAGVRPNLVTAVYARLTAARQEADGHWEPADARPPQHYSPFTDTALVMRAIQLYGHPSLQADTRARLDRARSWLLTHTPQVTEERVFQLFGSYWAGADRGALEKMATGLRATQQTDGGWSSLDGRSSEAYSTGETLFALHEAGGVAITDPAWRRGIEYLLRTQAADGSWHVESRLRPPAPVSPPYFETGYPYGHDQFISAMGASWSIMALATALGAGKEVAVTPLEEAKPKDIESWAETAIFGSKAELKRLLDGGFNPNSATKSGGTTALMMAAPDAEKMKLLIERGADVNARSKTRYSALMVAAQYPGSSAAMQMLLDRGAKLRLPAGQGAPLFNASPTLLAGFSGNSEVLAHLHEAGDSVDQKMFVIGMFPVTPLLMVATTHRTGAARALLDIGARVDEGDDDGITATSWAAITNRVEMARLLIERGADVNHVDRFGMTPLLYAASIDYGDSAMIDLLLKAGARADVRTKDGLTALDLARKYKHTHLLASLDGGARP